MSKFIRTPFLFAALAAVALAAGFGMLAGSTSTAEAAPCSTIGLFGADTRSGCTFVPHAVHTFGPIDPAKPMNLGNITITGVNYSNYVSQWFWSSTLHEMGLRHY